MTETIRVMKNMMTETISHEKHDDRDHKSHEKHDETIVDSIQSRYSPLPPEPRVSRQSRQRRHKHKPPRRVHRTLNKAETNYCVHVLEMLCRVLSPVFTW